jgi:hypothetical protein
MRLAFAQLAIAVVVHKYTFFKSLAILATCFPLPKHSRNFEQYQIIYTKLGQRYSLMYERSLADSAVRITGRKWRS